MSTAGLVELIADRLGYAAIQAQIEVDLRQKQRPDITAVISAGKIGFNLTTFNE